MGVGEVCKDIRDKLGEETGGADHGLFWPDTGKWLDPRRTLDFYDLKSGVRPRHSVSRPGECSLCNCLLVHACAGDARHAATQDLLEYRKKHRTLRVKMLDETVKTVLVDDSSSVHDLVITVCQKIGTASIGHCPPHPFGRRPFPR